jgi:hypothetical protein
VDNISVIVYREKNGRPVPKDDRTGSPVIKELTRFPAGLTDGMLIYWEDIDPWAGNECRNQAFSMARFWLNKTLDDDRNTAQ